MDTKMENQNENQKVNETSEAKTTPAPAAPAAEKPAEKPAEAAAAKPAAPKPAAPKTPAGPAYNLTVSVSPHAHSNAVSYTHLDVYKRQLYEFVSEMPKTISGKIRRVELREGEKNKS